MKTRILSIFFILLSTLAVFAKKPLDKTTKYKATIWAFPIGKVEGTISLTLFGENKGKLKIELNSINEKNGSKSSETVEVLTAGVKLIMIDSVLYKFINFRADKKNLTLNYCVAIKDEKSTQYQLSASDTAKYFLETVVFEENETLVPLEDCCLKKVYGRDSFAIYQFGLSWNNDNAIVALPKAASYSKFMAINNAYFTRVRMWRFTQFRNCPTLKNNINENKEGWIFDNQTPQATKIEIWKKYIDTWESCQIKIK